MPLFLLHFSSEKVCEMCNQAFFLVKFNTNSENRCEFFFSSSLLFIFFHFSVEVSLWVIWKKFNQSVGVILIENSPYSKGETIADWLSLM